MDNKLLNAKLRGMFKLSHKVTVYIPTKDINNDDISQDLINRMEDEVCSKLSEVNGGATGTDGIGYWKLPNGQLCKEKVRMIFSYTQDLEKAIDTCIELATWIKKTANQDAVSIEIDNELIII